MKFTDGLVLALLLAVENPRIDHNHIHDNLQELLVSHKSCQNGNSRPARFSYGILVGNADAIIEANFFDRHRHHIAGSGLNRSSYRAFLNVSLENQAAAFDMHSCQGRPTHPSCLNGILRAGERVSIFNNTFYDHRTRALLYRGQPESYMSFHNNFIIHPHLLPREDVIRFRRGVRNVFIGKKL